MPCLLFTREVDYIDGMGWLCLARKGKQWDWRGRLRRCAFLVNCVEALDHSVPDERMQPEVCGTFHLDEFDAGLIAMYPPHMGFIDRQRLGLIGKHEAQCNTLVCQ